MPIRVELTDDAIEDLRERHREGTLPAFLAKLVRLEDVGEDAGVPLGGELTGFRKIVVGDRTWRVIFRMNPAETIATVWVLGNRADAECYALAARRLTALQGRNPATASLAQALVQLLTGKRPRRR